MSQPELPRRQLLAASAGLLLGATGVAVTGATLPERLRFGIVPYLPARRLVALYSPLVPVLQATLNRPVDIVSAPDYGSHFQRLKAAEYDVVADSLFLSRIAQRDLGHVPVARTRAMLEPLLVVPVDGAIHKPADLIGQAVCVTDRLAALSVIGLRHLRDLGVTPDEKVRVVVSGSHANSLNRMLAGDAAAAIVSKTTLHQVAAMAPKVRVLTVTPPGLSAVVYHVRAPLAPSATALTRAMLHFAAETPEGLAFIEALGHEGLVPATSTELSRLDPMVSEFYSQLSSSK